MSRNVKNIFCLEGDWTGDLKKPSTVRPIFDLVTQIEPKLRYIHRGIGTSQEFDHYLKVWRQRKYADFPLLYLAFHGNAQSLSIGDQRRHDRCYTLDKVAGLLASGCKGRIVHFGACSTLKCDLRHLKRFLARTGALAVSGYTKDIGWMESAAFEVFLLSALQKNARTITGAKAIYARIDGLAKRQAKDLGFRMVVRSR